jgi:hypothetical protein
MKSIDKAQIAPHLNELASGGEGVVFLIANRPGDVYKEYKQVVRGQLNIAALRNLVAMPDQMTPSDRQRLMERTAWPHTLVNTGAMTHGFLMEKVSPRFMRRYGLRTHQKSVLCEWTYLVYQKQELPANMASDIPILSFGQKIELLKDFAATMEIMHRYGIVVGDISGRNLLWTSNPESIFIIDCDSFRVDGQPGTTESKESPHFMDPHKPKDQPTDKSTDIYKLAIAAYRAIWHDAQGEPTPESVRQNLPNEVPGGLADLIARSIGPGPRPTAADWKSGLDNLFKFGGRKVIKAKDPTNPGVRSVPPAVGTPAPPKPRPILKLQ